LLESFFTWLIIFRAEEFLFTGYLAFIFNEFGTDAENEVLMNDELGFQNVMVVLNRCHLAFSVFMPPEQTFVTVPVVEAAQCRGVDKNLPILSPDAAIVKSAAPS
jgi:hypothetical protein